jgi:acetyltransferase
MISLASRQMPATAVADSFQLPDGRLLRVRPIQLEDEPALAAFHHTLSPESVYFRYFNELSLSQRIAHPRLQHHCSDDGGRATVLVAVAEADGVSPAQEIIAGVGRLVRLPDDESAEFALLISDPFQGRGVGSELLARLIRVARAAGLKKLIGLVLGENHPMRDLCRKLNFDVRWDETEGALRAELELTGNPDETQILVA